MATKGNATMNLRNEMSTSGDCMQKQHHFGSFSISDLGKLFPLSLDRYFLVSY